MAEVTKNVFVLGDKIIVTLTYDDVTMLLTGASVVNSSGKSLTFRLISPKTRTFTIDAGNRSVSIPAAARPTWAYETWTSPNGTERTIISGFTWMITVNE